LQAHHSAWTTCLFAGEPALAREHCEAGRRLYDPERYHLHHQLYGPHDPGACARNVAAQAHWLLGYPEQGIALGSEALAYAERIAHPFSLAIVLQFYSMLHLNRGEPELALARGGGSTRCRATTWLRDGTAAPARCGSERTGSVRRSCRLF